MSEWISVKDRMPTGEPRLLYVHVGEGFEMCVGYFNRLTGAYHIEEETYPGLDVTHWMPLPQPPAK